MASFPVLDQKGLKAFLSRYQLDETCHIDSSYRARAHSTCRFHISDPGTAATQAYLLLVVEPNAIDHLTFISSLIEHLVALDTLVTPCLKNKQDEYISLFGHCPAILFHLPGDLPPSNQKLTTLRCGEIGTFLGKMHTNSKDFDKTYGNPRSLVWLNLAADELLPQLSAGDACLLREQLGRFKSTIDINPNLPSGPLIGSLFRDQLFFQGDHLEAVTGFYFSCTDWLLLDVAQAVNEWCSNEQGELDKHLTKSLLSAYHAVRPFTPCENQYWQDILCFSATRFWISRLLSSLLPDQAGRPSIQQNPQEYKVRLRRRITGYHPLPVGSPD
ncbi:MAG: hypothetical protein QNK31_04445 [Porticoccus sp.]|nr:hypothetical protein [Porticoccus sp.]